MKKQKISVIGLGYVGLPLLCAIAKQKQYDAVGYNRSDDKIKKIVKKKCPIDDEVCAKDLYELDVLNVSSNPDIMKNSVFQLLFMKIILQTMNRSKMPRQ